MIWQLQQMQTTPTQTTPTQTTPTQIPEFQETVEVDGWTTITLGALIQQLLELQKKLGPNAPVWHVEFGGITATGGAEEYEDGVAIE
jgi:hypothetical protein